MEKSLPAVAHAQVLQVLAQLLIKNKREMTIINTREKSYANSIIASPSVLGEYVQGG
jgi:hypothetical protein